MPVGSNSLPASSHTLWATKSHLQGVSWTINCCCLLLAHCECEVCIRDTFLSHVRELMSVCLQPSWPHFHAFLGHRSSGESLCRGDPPPELIISSRKCFAFAKSCSALRISSFFQWRTVSVGFCSALSRGSGFFQLFSVAEFFVWSLALFMHTSSSSSLSDFETSFYNPSYQQPSWLALP